MHLTSGSSETATLAPGDCDPRQGTVGIDRPWPWGSDWSCLAGQTARSPTAAGPSPAPVCSCLEQGAGASSIPRPAKPVSDTPDRGTGAMRSLSGLLLLLTACLAVNASPCPHLMTFKCRRTSTCLGKAGVSGSDGGVSEPLGLAGGKGQVLCALGSQSLHLELQGWVPQGPSCCSDCQDFTGKLHRATSCGTLGCHSESKI